MPYIRKPQSILTTASVLFAAVLLNAQNIPQPKYKFDVASIKPNKSQTTNVWFTPGPNGGLRTENTNTMALLTFAFDVRDYQIIGAPGWVNADRFNIIATADQPEAMPGPNMKRDEMEASFARQRQRMQGLLLDRFNLVIKPETREMPIYSLLIAKGGAKLTEAAEGPPNMRMQRGRLMARGMTLDNLTNALSTILGRPVANDTGLTARYDFEFEWTPDTPATDDGVPGDGPPTIFTAIREKLGLRLESKKGPGKVYVIERIEKPSEN